MHAGGNDPVFDHPARVLQLDNALDRVTYKDAEPSLEFRRRLLQPGTYAFYAMGHDADGFFVQLARRLAAVRNTDRLEALLAGA